MIRWGLCCAFRNEPIKFRNTTATAIGKLPRVDALAKLSRLCLENADALLRALEYCAAHDIECFRVNSQILPLKTHPACGYDVGELPDAAEIINRFQACGDFVKKRELRTSFHPDQFVVLNSQRPEVIESSLRELEYQSQVAEWIAADVVNVHGGGAFGDKRKALSDFVRNIDRLSPVARRKLTVENDDTIFTPADLLPICKINGIPLVYDVHHHRCHPDGLTIAEATEQAAATWNREPMFHISSPLNGWEGPQPERHHDFIDSNDVPDVWGDLNVTVEVEAKAKEAAVLKLVRDWEERRHQHSASRTGHPSPSAHAHRSATS